MVLCLAYLCTARMHGALVDMRERVRKAFRCPARVPRQAVQRFAVADLSNWYLDVIKDRLYVSAPASPDRRAAQTVLHALVQARKGFRCLCYKQWKAARSASHVLHMRAICPRAYLRSAPWQVCTFNNVSGVCTRCQCLGLQGVCWDWDCQEGNQIRFSVLT